MIYRQQHHRKEIAGHLFSRFTGIVTYLIELILRFDEDFSFAYKEELEERRQNFSVDLLDQFFEECENLLKLTPTMQRTITADAKCTLKVVQSTHGEMHWAMHLTTDRSCMPSLQTVILPVPTTLPRDRYDHA